MSPIVQKCLWVGLTVAALLVLEFLAEVVAVVYPKWKEGRRRIMAYKSKRPHVECSSCGREMMPTEDGRFRPHVRYRQSSVTPRLREAAGALCPGSGRLAVMGRAVAEVTFTNRPDSKSSRPSIQGDSRK